eukprot:445002_1
MENIIDIDKKENQVLPWNNRNNLSLYRFTKADIANKIQHWVENDVKHQNNKKQSQETFNHFPLSGDLISRLQAKIAKAIVKEQMVQFMTSNTLNIIFDSFEKWKNKNPDDLIAKSAEQISDTLYAFPLANLIKRINNDNIDGKQFMSKKHIIAEETGWNKDECYQIESILLKHHTFTREQFITYMQNVFIINYSKTLTEDIRNKVEEVVLDFDVEDLHYRIKNAENVQDFSDRLINMVDELVQKNPENIDVIKIIYEAVAECFIDKNGISELSEERLHWKCFRCGNKNVNSFIGSKMTKRVKICTLCGIRHKESIVLQLRDRPTFVMVNEIDDDVDDDDDQKDDKKLDDIDSMIETASK